MTVCAIVLTFNEEVHLARCLGSIRAACDSILVVDSGSTDKTVAIAQAFGAKVLVHRFVNYSSQLNFAICALNGVGGWLLRIDADEVLLDDEVAVVQALNAAPNDVAGLLLKRRMHFMGRPMKWGGMDPVWQLRIWREGHGICEQRWMDEHVIVDGGVMKTNLRIDDMNLNSLTWWTEKHNWYASREAIDVLCKRHDLLPLGNVARTGGVDQIVVKRALKNQVYLRLKPGARALVYFLYRYVFRLGFLDGREGWYFHVLQGFWYRTLVDAKVSEIEAYAQKFSVPLLNAIEAVTGIQPVPKAEGSRQNRGNLDA